RSVHSKPLNDRSENQTKCGVKTPLTSELCREVPKVFKLLKRAINTVRFNLHRGSKLIIFWNNGAELNFVYGGRSWRDRPIFFNVALIIQLHARGNLPALHGASLQ